MRSVARTEFEGFEPGNWAELGITVPVADPQNWVVFATPLGAGASLRDRVNGDYIRLTLRTAQPGGYLAGLIEGTWFVVDGLQAINGQTGRQTPGYVALKQFVGSEGNFDEVRYDTLLRARALVVIEAAILAWAREGEVIALPIGWQEDSAEWAVENQRPLLELVVNGSADGPKRRLANAIMDALWRG